MLPKVYIDGHVGTTGLRIRDWMADRTDVELVTLPDQLRKDSEARRATIRESDVVLLCLPDDAARKVAGANGALRGQRITNPMGHEKGR